MGKFVARSIFLFLMSVSCAQADFLGGLLGAVVTNNGPLVKPANYAKNERLKSYQNIPDKEFVNNFYSATPDGEEHVNADLVADGYKLQSLDLHHVVLQKQMFKASGKEELDAMMANYTSNSRSDLMAKIYVAAAKNRGNTVRLYKPKVSFSVNSAVEDSTGRSVAYVGHWGYWDYDNPMIEYNKEGEVVSMMSRSHQAKTTVGVESNMYVQIVYSRAAIRSFENEVENDKLANLYIRDM
ncbi:MAG: hypothetical protein WC856_20545 [Methylococcaceae bacterium]|jgi:hypothetical protein